MSIVLDTGPLVALLNHRDIHHPWTVQQARILKPPFLTCEAVLAEAHFLLSRLHQGGRRLNELVSSGKLQFPFSYDKDASRVHRHMRTYEDLPMSFADACIVVQAESTRRSRILTLDSDFRVYRTGRGKALDLIIP